MVQSGFLFDYFYAKTFCNVAHDFFEPLRYRTFQHFAAVLYAEN